MSLGGEIDVSSPVPFGTCAICRKPVAPSEALDDEADLHAECIEGLIDESDLGNKGG